MSDLNYRPLGRSGLLVSAVGIGCNNFGREGTVTESLDGTRAVVDTAIDAGVTLFDTADIYGREYGLSEELLGQAIAGRRDEIVLATKFGHVDYESPIPNWGAKGSRRYIRLAVEGSLRRLGTDWIDLYQLHTPDPFTPIEETIAALDELVQEGKIRYAGHSNFAGWQLTEADWAARTAGHPAFISAQNEYSLLVRGAERELFPAMRAAGVGFLPYFPLYNGLFTGKFSRDGGPADSRIMRQRKHLLDTAPWDAIEAYQAFCDERGISMLEATFGWLLAQDGLTSVIAGATTPQQIRANAAAGSAWSPTAEEAAWISDRFPVG
ncbi:MULTISPECIES: aldo/keto reductase [Plantibacter]|uniref:aldo/keto reductase n=1 Tax=Plantibacter TaxID=190323 RepID=UPI001784CEAD|nr:MULTISPECIES: aldo/keto reductase [Plantibacter]MBD8103408.1 aldo/keto reductase [Plantibacter sp. CFBP 8775]MBD8535274.1 aldo/keto reductase [Plantibacter sp. CFBP 13570]CAH0165431.1 L-glyceraldehyde 3-phosphate reductase [Plantibacter cousiniae]